MKIISFKLYLIITFLSIGTFIGAMERQEPNTNWNFAKEKEAAIVPPAPTPAPNPLPILKANSSIFQDMRYYTDDTI